MVARRAGYASIVLAVVALVAAVWSLVAWRSGSPGPGLVVSILACLAGFAVGVATEAIGSDRRDLRVGLAGLLVNAAFALGWGFVLVGLLLGSS